MFSLLDEKWLPVQRLRSGFQLIRPSDLTDSIEDDPVLAPIWGRADFDAATRELLIGLLATACPPADHDAWQKWWESPPAAAELAVAFALYARAFVIDGDGPRFMQDQADLNGEAVPVSQLLIEAPGGNTEKLNKDLFEKRGRVAAMSRASAAMALFTLQTYAPSGGQGHRTSLRGGGPLTTLVTPIEDPSKPVPFWRQLWLNVVPPREGDVMSSLCEASVFPWLGKTRTSEGDRGTTPEDVDPAQAYWGMPRRIRLDFIENATDEPCAISGRRDTVLVRTYRTKNLGTKYEGWGRRHPLTPSYKAKKDASEWLSVHVQPGGIGYRNWVALVQAEGVNSLPAAAVTIAKERLIDQKGPSAGRRARLLASGYDTDNMKARGFVESEMPLYLLPSGLRGDFEDFCHRMVASSNEVAGLLAGSVRAALFSNGSSVNVKRELFASLRERLFLETESDFFLILDNAASELVAGGSHSPAETASRWLKRLREVALHLFDEASPLDPDAVVHIPRVIEARRNLFFALGGYGKRGTSLLQILQIPQPGTNAAPKRRKEAA